MKFGKGHCCHFEMAQNYRWPNNASLGSNFKESAFAILLKAHAVGMKIAYYLSLDEAGANTAQPKLGLC